MIITPKMNLVLNFKPEGKSYKFVIDKPTEVSQQVLDYLQKVYPNKFEQNETIFDVINTFENDNKHIKIENSIINDRIEIDSDNILNNLIQSDSKSGESSKLDVKQIIEKAIEQNIIIKNNLYYKVEDRVIKTLKKVKEVLDSDKDLLNRIEQKILK